MASSLAAERDLDEVLHWLQRYDSRPTLIPEWPADSTRMALVLVRPPAEMLVVLSPDELRVLSDPDLGLTRLFFRIPKTILVSSGLCPDLTLSSWLT